MIRLRNFRQRFGLAVRLCIRTALNTLWKHETNWMSTVGANINEVERQTCEKVGCKYAVALSAGTAALHMAVKLAGEKIYGKSETGKDALYNHKVFCSDMTFDATVNPVVYEGGIQVFIDTEYDT